MSEHNQVAEQVEKHPGDGVADAFAAVAVMTVIIATVVYWLAGMPS